MRGRDGQAGDIPFGADPKPRLCAEHADPGQGQPGDGRRDLDAGAVLRICPPDPDILEVDMVGGDRNPGVAGSDRQDRGRSGVCPVAGPAQGHRTRKGHRPGIDAGQHLDRRSGGGGIRCTLETGGGRGGGRPEAGRGDQEEIWLQLHCTQPCCVDAVRHTVGQGGQLGDRRTGGQRQPVKDVGGGLEGNECRVGAALHNRCYRYRQGEWVTIGEDVAGENDRVGSHTGRAFDGNA